MHIGQQAMGGLFGPPEGLELAIIVIVEPSQALGMGQATCRREGWSGIARKVGRECAQHVQEDKPLPRLQPSWPLSCVWFHRTQKRAWL